MSAAMTQFTQPDETMPFGRRLMKITKYLNIGLPSFTGTLKTSSPEDRRWRIDVHIPGRTFGRNIKPIDFYLEAPNWSLGQSIAAHTSLGRIRLEYREDLQGTSFMACGRRDQDGEIVRTVEDDTVASYVQDLEEHIRSLEKIMCRGMRTSRKLINRNIELEDELKETREEYEDEIHTLLKKHEEVKLLLEEAEEKLDQGEDLQNDISDGCYVSQDKDYDDLESNDVEMSESSTDSN